MEKKVLILTYYWPPGSGPGVQRWLKFSKFLSKAGWSIEVITVADGSYPSTDNSLVDDIPNDVEVFKTRSLEPFKVYNMLRGKSGSSIEVGMSNLKGKQTFFKKLSNYIRANLFIPDARVGWNTYAYPKAIERIKKNTPDLIITTGPPHSTHLIGLKLKSMYQHIKWVADLRDPWINIYYNHSLNRTVKSKQKDQRLENEVVQKADGITVASPGLLKEFQSRSKAISFIPNGFDSSDFNKDLVLKKNEKCTLVYVGNFKEAQNIPALWQALSSLSLDPGFRENFTIKIIGNVAQSILDQIELNYLSNLVKAEPFVKHKEAVLRMMQADLLLLPIPISSNNQNIITGKIFEYLASRRPILAIGPTDGDAARILAECGKSSMLDYKDKDGIETRLREELTFFNNRAHHRVTGNEAYEAYSRQGTTRQLIQFIEERVL